MKGLIHRAQLLCDIKEDLLCELELLRNVFISKGYPRKLVEKTINDSWKVELKKQIYIELDEVDLDHHKTEEKSEYFNTLHAPYIAGFSEKLAKDLKHINVGITFSKGHTFFNSFCRLKPPCAQDMRKNVIYCLNCMLCPQIYLGETQQWFPSRRYQHQYEVRNKFQTNGIAQHVTKTKHEIDWENTIFLDSETHWRRRKIKEALYIDSLNRKANFQQHYEP